MKLIDCFNIFLFEDTLSIELDILKILNKKNIRLGTSGRKSTQYNVDLKSIKLFTNAVEKNFLYFKEKLGFQDKHNLFFKNAFVNINPPYSYNISHMHPDCFLTGAYYFKAPIDSGNLVLKHPSSCKGLDDYSYKTYNSFNNTLFNISPKEGKIYIFPNYIDHYVEPNYSKEDRISMSFNIGVK
jgi:uncharacterized protein (TIGR02466 family)